jgi:hypothetical protein
MYAEQLSVDNRPARPNGWDCSAKARAGAQAGPSGLATRFARRRRRQAGVIAAGGGYSSHTVEWRRARDVGALKQLASKGKPSGRSPEQVEIDCAQRPENFLAKRRRLASAGRVVPGGRPFKSRC